MTQYILWGICIIEAIGLIFLFIKGKEYREGAEKAKVETAGFAKEVEILTQNKKEQETETTALRTEVTNLRADAVRLETEKKNLETAQDQLKKDKEELLTTYKSQFETLATDILNKQTQLFKQGNKEEMEHVIKPLNERLAEFKQKVETFASENHSDKTAINDKIKHIEEVAQKFVSSLKVPSGSRAWGENTLRELLESMNFQKGVTYFEQVTNDDKRPDFLVRLPDNRLVVIDAKTIYSDYEKYTQEPDVTEQAKHLKAHVTKIRNTIASLGKKKYEKAIADFCKDLQLPADEDPIDLVLMFVNPEGALSSALQADSSIYELAQENNVVLVSSSTLVGALEIIHTLWVNNRAQEDYEEMTRLAESLVGGFGQFLAANVNVTNALNNAQEAHQKSLNIIGNAETKGLLKNAQDLANLAPSKISMVHIKTIKKAGYHYTGEEQ